DDEVRIPDEDDRLPREERADEDADAPARRAPREAERALHEREDRGTEREPAREVREDVHRSEREEVSRRLQHPREGEERDARAPLAHVEDPKHARHQEVGERDRYDGSERELGHALTILARRDHRNRRPSLRPMVVEATRTKLYARPDDDPACCAARSPRRAARAAVRAGAAEPRRGALPARPRPPPLPRPHRHA